MFEVEIGGEKVKAEVTFGTAQLYEMEFRSDLIQDLYGVQTAEPTIELEEPDSDDPEAVREFVEKVLEAPEEYIAKVDFTKVSWNAIMRVLWAAVKTADKNAPGYTAWMQKAAGANLWDIQETLGAAVTECFFRPQAAREDS